MNEKPRQTRDFIANVHGVHDHDVVDADFLRYPYEPAHTPPDTTNGEPRGLCAATRNVDDGVCWSCYAGWHNLCEPRARGMYWCLCEHILHDRLDHGLCMSTGRCQGAAEVWCRARGKWVCRACDRQEREDGG